MASKSRTPATASSTHGHRATVSSVELKSSVKVKSSEALPWSALSVGDTVDVIAPGFRPTDGEVEAGVQFLESWGLRARLPKDLFGSDVVSSHSDKMRFKHISSALLAQDSKAIWCLRGGYGSIRLIPDLLKLKRPKKSKILIGFSDVTTLQLWLSQNWNWPSLQAPLLDRLGRCIDQSLVSDTKPRPLDAQVEELRRIVFGETSTVLFEGLRFLNKVKSVPSKRLRGKMTGGNLVTFASAIGTKIHPVTVGQIVYFEDLGERGYRIDRILQQLVQSEVLNRRTTAVVFGEFMGGLEPDGSSKISAVIDRFATTWAEKNCVPVFSGIASGHGVNQRVVPIGTEGVIDLRSSSIEIETAVSYPNRSHSKTIAKVRKKTVL